MEEEHKQKEEDRHFLMIFLPLLVGFGSSTLTAVAVDDSVLLSSPLSAERELKERLEDDEDDEEGEDDVGEEEEDDKREEVEERPEVLVGFDLTDFFSSIPTALKKKQRRERPGGKSNRTRR
jgi:TATA-binding protein-associated factor Taf7